MKLSKEIISAIEKAVEETDSQADFAKKCGLGKNYINQYLSGRVKGINMGTLEKLLPHIKKFLPKGFKNLAKFSAQTRLSAITDKELIFELVQRGYTIKKN